MASPIAHPHESKIYSEFSRYYDKIFENVFFPRIKRVIGGLGIEPGSSVLEVGVGTGLALSAYPTSCHVTGIDLAPDMLERARRKVDREGWKHIDLAVGDAQDLDFPDDSFDYVTSFHVVSVVPDPKRMMREMVRVCRPGGTIVIINHFRSERPVIASVVDRLDPVTRKLGWRTTLRMSELLDSVSLELVRRYKTSPQSLFTVMIARKPTAASARAAS
ncbi:methyltransferase domain-containing protein [Candidatus Binatia bacterium]|jgi:phosphatidylethanolamine/phosphatidyl-N-methylethanolamine N-methyltransferase|nr:methyltransferase domain-containing protein [Candidatus Binatia bacterium]